MKHVSNSLDVLSMSKTEYDEYVRSCIDIGRKQIKNGESITLDELKTQFEV